MRTPRNVIVSPSTAARRAACPRTLAPMRSTGRDVCLGGFVTEQMIEVRATLRVLRWYGRAALENGVTLEALSPCRDASIR